MANEKNGGTVDPGDVSVKLIDLAAPPADTAALTLGSAVALVLNGAVHDRSGGGDGGGGFSAGEATEATPSASPFEAGQPDALPPLSMSLTPASLSRLKAASYAACFAAVVLLRDPVLLFACLVTLVTVFFGEWWFLYVASAVPLMYHITTTFNFLNGGMVPHVVAAASALNNMLNMVFVGVALIAAWPSLKALISLDVAGAWALSGRFSFIMATVAAKIVVENAAAEAIASFFAQAFMVARGVVGFLVSVLGFIPGIIMDAVASAVN